MNVECPYCGANNLIKDNATEFVCSSCEKSIGKKTDRLISTNCPKCNFENKIEDWAVYNDVGGLICSNCENFIPKNKKFENRGDIWEKNLTGAEKVVTGAAVGFAGIGAIVLIIGFLLICFLLLFIL